MHPFDYISILVSLILGLGITQTLSSISDLFYNYKKVRFYWPHTLWVIFIMFLHIQDWFVTYQLKDKKIWHLAELMFVLLYPVTLFIVVKMILPTNETEEHIDMKVFFKKQYPIMFLVFSISIILSILFNIFLLSENLAGQAVLIAFLGVILYGSRVKPDQKYVHEAIAVLITVSAVVSIIIQKDVWVIK